MMIYAKKSCLDFVANYANENMDHFLFVRMGNGTLIHGMLGLEAQSG